MLVYGQSSTFENAEWRYLYIVPHLRSYFDRGQVGDWQSTFSFWTLGGQQPSDLPNNFENDLFSYKLLLSKGKIQEF